MIIFYKYNNKFYKLISDKPQVCINYIEELEIK